MFFTVDISEAISDVTITTWMYLTNPLLCALLPNDWIGDYNISGYLYLKKGD
jgi:hypothetical protein